MRNTTSTATPHVRLRSEQYKLILDSLSEGVCTVDRDWNITSYNRAAQELTGYTAEEAVQFSFGDIFRCEVRECQLLMAGVMESGEAIQNVCTKFADRHGQRVPVSLNAVPLRNEHGEIVGVVASFRDDRPLESLRRELEKNFIAGDIVSKNPAMRRILDILPDISDSGSTVLILGETGTGKELLARAIHNTSPRRNKPFVAVNCGALPETLLESELFGYRKGAFSDAKKDKPGRFALADGGTLFLDEIGDIPPSMQVKLLRVLQEKVYEPLGGVQPVKADVRLVAATNRDLAALVEAGQFRADLYYRLNVIRLELPPLKERAEDIPLLAGHLLRRLALEKGRGEKQLTPEALQLLAVYEYPGNIRELQNILERAYVLARGCAISPDCLPRELHAVNLSVHPVQQASREPAHRLTSNQDAISCTLDIASPGIRLRDRTPEQQKELILRVLAEVGGKRKEAAARLGIDASTLWRKIRKIDTISNR